MTEEHPPATDLSRGTAQLRLTLLAVTVVSAAALAVAFGPDVDAIRRWTAGTGWVAPAVFSALYAGLTVGLVPGSVLTVAAGLLFGAGLGSVLTVVGATAGAVAAFTIGRRAGRAAVERLASGRVARVDRWLSHRGLVAVITLRLVPLVPFSASNYAAGITGIRLRDFAVGTAIGIVPGTVAYAVLGARVTDPTDPTFLSAMLGLALLTVGGSVLLRRSRRAGGAQPSRPSSRRDVARQSSSNP